MRITNCSSNLPKLVERMEGLKLKAYKCPAGIWTIGMGSTFYEDGSRIKEGDTITKERAYTLLTHALKGYEQFVDNNTRDDINQNQFDALVDFAYNCGNQALKGSSLLKKVNLNPKDISIRSSFEAWVYGGDGSHNGVDDDRDGLVDEPNEKKRLKGLENRRTAEANLYFS